jgi:hypothetical protein
VYVGEDVPLTRTLLIVSKKAIKLTDEHLYLRKFLADRGFFLLNRNVFSIEEGFQKVNARRALSSTRVERENVTLAVLSDETIRDRWGYDLEKGYYAVVYNVESLVYGQFMIVKNYGRSSLMQYGKDDFISAQMECYRMFESLLSDNVLTRKPVCYRCLEVVEKGVHHQNLCVPYMRNFFEPSPKRVIITEDDYVKFESLYKEYKNK